MKSNITQTPHSRLAEACKSLRKRPSLKALLSCIALAIRLGISAAPIEATLGKAGITSAISASGDAAVDELIDWLQHYQFRSPRPTEAESQALSELEELHSSTAPSSLLVDALTPRQYAEKLLSLERREQARASNPADPYGPFRASWELADKLNEVFPQGNPGHVIGTYLRQAFAASDATPSALISQCSDAATILLVSTVALGVSSTILAKLTAEPAITTAQAGACVDGLILLAARLNALVSNSDGPCERTASDGLALVRQILRSRPALASVLFRHIDIDPVEPVARAHVFDLITRIPLGPERAWADGMDGKYGRTDIAPHAYLPWTQIVGICERLLEDVSQSLFRFSSSERSMFDDGVDRLLGNMFKGTQWIGCGTLPMDFGSLDYLLWLFARTSAGDYEAVEHWHCFDAHFDRSGHDVRWLLAQDIFSLSEFLGEHWFENDDASERARRLRQRARRFFLASQSAASSGLVELGCALAAFGVFSQSMTGMPSLYFTARELRDMAASFVSASNFESLQRAMAAALGGALKDVQSPETSVLKSIAANTLCPQVESRNAALSRSEIKSHVLQQVGNEGWVILAPATKEFLVDAEMHYSRLHLELGKPIGQGLKNWGSVGNAYAKSVESELVFRLRDVFASPVYAQMQEQQGRKQDLPTLGSCLYLFRSFSKLPAAVVHLMSATGCDATFVTERSGVLAQLQELRNKATHPNEFAPSDFHNIRRLTYQFFREKGR
mgnify:CR=1 FL=1